MSAMETSRDGDTGVVPAGDLERSVIQLPGGSLIAYRLLAERVRRLLGYRRYRIPVATRAELEREILIELQQAVRRPDFDPPGGALGFVEMVALQHVLVWQRARKVGESAHPADDLLVRSAVAARLLSASERERLAQHLAGCRACREMAALAGDALRSARRMESGRGRRPLVFRAAPWLALAALPILALALAFLVRPAGLPEDPAVRRETVAPGASPADRPTVPTGEGVATVAGESLAGTRRVEARRAIVATSVTIAPGSEVTFRAGEVVVLGDGFAIAAGAALTIEIAETPPAEAPDRRD